MSGIKLKIILNEKPMVAKLRKLSLRVVSLQAISSSESIPERISDGCIRILEPLGIR
jgi:hypothetical protein